MSRLWSFYSYSQPEFDAYLGGGRAGAAEELTAAAMWDEDAWDDPEAVRVLCSTIARRGVDYAGLSPSEAALLDALVPALFAPEGLAEPWSVEAESPDGLHPSAMNELLPRSQGAALLPMLLGGRRHGEPNPSQCGYCFLTPTECAQLVSEAERALASNSTWNEKWVPEVVNECLIGPLRSAMSKGRPVFGVLA
jgi:hypothetical protein